MCTPRTSNENTIKKRTAKKEDSFFVNIVQITFYSLIHVTKSILIRKVVSYMEKYSTHKRIELKIRNKPKGTLFVISDFAELGSNNTIKKSLTRLVKEDKLKKVFRGIYKKPNFNAFIKEEIISSPKEIANAYARAYGWNIVPSGNAALNELGLSKQVPNVNIFISNGPSKTIELNNNTKIIFKKVTNREISNMSYEQRC